MRWEGRQGQEAGKHCQMLCLCTVLCGTDAICHSAVFFWAISPQSLAVYKCKVSILLLQTGQFPGKETKKCPHILFMLYAPVYSLLDNKTDQKMSSKRQKYKHIISCVESIASVYHRKSSRYKQVNIKPNVSKRVRLHYRTLKNQSYKVLWEQTKWNENVTWSMEAGYKQDCTTCLNFGPCCKGPVCRI